MRLRICVAMLAWIGSIACGERAAATSTMAADPSRDSVELDERSQRQAGIRVAAVEAVLRADSTEAPGVLALDERRTARIGSLVQGIVFETYADVGDRVRARMVLATMNSPIVHEAWADYRKAIADRRRLEKELAFAAAALDRARRLFADKAISQQDLQRAEADRVAAEETLDMGRTEVRRAEEELEHLGVTNAEDPSGESGEQVPVRTPIAGVVLERLITPGTTVTPGTPLYVVSDLSALWALVEVDESLLSRMHVGQNVALRVGAYPGEAFSGTVAFIGDMVNPRTRRVTVRCAIANEHGRLKPHMYATALLQERVPRQVVVVPEDAIQHINGEPTVFVAEDGGRFRPRTIAVGATDKSLVEVHSGLASGERIAVAGTFVLKSEWLKTASEE